MIRTTLKLLLPLAVVAASLAGAMAVVASAPEPEPRKPEDTSPVVETALAERTDVRLDVTVYGTVRPRTEVRVVPQVPGRVVWVSPSLEEGAFFEAGAPLLRIERTDYELAVTRAEASLAQARAGLAREEAEAAIAAKEWREYGRGEPGPLALREPQLAQARAAVAAAEASLAGARLDLSRTEIAVPFAGRVQSESVDVGQFVPAGSPVATVHATDYAEVRLAVPADQVGYLDLPLAWSAPRADAAGPAVRLTGDLGGPGQAIEGVVVRTAAEVDPRSRVVSAVARVGRPYELDPPLLPGMYVRGVIEGRTVRDVIALPRAALRGRNVVWVVDAGGRLAFRRVEVLRRTAAQVVLSGGVEPGERVCLTNLAAAVEGMRVREAGGGAAR